MLNSIKHKNVFYQFPCFEGEVKGAGAIDFLGTYTAPEFLDITVNHAKRHIKTMYPPFDEEYFEWIDLLESVVLANNEYVMMEFGAGYGRWAVRAAFAADKMQLATHLVAVEAEPIHFNWLRSHFLNNGLDPDQHLLINAALSDREGETTFYIGMPDGGHDKPNEWYGQSLTKEYEQEISRIKWGYADQEVINFLSGFRAIKMNTITPAQIMRQYRSIDLIDLDIQGEELKVITSCIAECTKKVKRLHIGTHSAEIETGLRALLKENNWKCIYDYPFNSINETPYGNIQFVDGAQSWINSKFIGGNSK